MKLMRLYEELVIEKTFSITSDVDYIYKKGGFENFIREYEKGLKPKESEITYGVDVLFERIKSEDLPSVESKNASSVTIFCGIFKQGSYYKPSTDEIYISLSKNALEVLYDMGSFNLTPSQKKTIVNEITESRIKAAISHELSHWLDDVTHNNYLEKILSLSRNDQKKIITNDVNTTYFEIEGQIHGIKAIYNVNKSIWDELTLEDLFIKYPSLTSILQRVSDKYGIDISNIWQKALVKRLDREGLLGKNMRKFVKV